MNQSTYGSLWILGGLGVGTLRERKSRKEQISETGLIRQQKAIRFPGWIPENVNKVMVDKDQKDRDVSADRDITPSGTAAPPGLSLPASAPRPSWSSVLQIFNGHTGSFSSFWMTERMHALYAPIRVLNHGHHRKCCSHQPGTRLSWCKCPAIKLWLTSIVFFLIY